ncbi:MAG: hypothetical protein M0P31_13580 [Solirubrobacteraceae bacterium]|nr:hypothetical protein [Solirubrobacteraceae bacterium]
MSTTTLPDRRWIDLAARSGSGRPLHVVARALEQFAEHHDIPRTQIAAEAGVTETVITTWARNAGLPSRRETSRDDLDRAIAAWERTRSVSAAARELGVTRNTVRRRLRLAGYDIRPDRSTAVRDALAEAYRPPDGYVGTMEAARLLDVDPSTTHRWCVEGRIPGALRERRRSDEGTGRLRWLIPEAWIDRQRDIRRARGSAPSRRGRDRAAPFAAWLARQDLSLDELAWRADIADGGRLRAILRGEVTTVGLSTADAVLTANDARLEDVWGDIDQRIAAADGLAEVA